MVDKNPMPPPPTRWMEAVEALNTPLNSGELIAKFKSETIKCDSEIQNMIARSKAVIASYASLANSFADLATASTQFSEAETNDIDTLNTLSPAELSSGAASSSVPNVLSRISTMFSSQVSALKNTPDALNLLGVEALSYESSQMQGEKG